MKITSGVASLGLLLLTLGWGVSFPLVNVAMRSTPPLEFVAIRFLLAAVVLFGIAVTIPGASWRLQKKGPAVLCGVLLFLGFALQTFSLIHTTATRSAFFTALSTVLVPCFEWLLFRRRFRPAILVGVLLSFAGLVLLSVGSGAFVEASATSGVAAIGPPNQWVGDLLAFGCAIVFAFVIIALARLGGEEGSLAFAAWQILLVGVLAALSSTVVESARWVWPTPAVWTTILFLALVATALASVAQIAFQRRTSATEAGLIFAMEPVFAAWFAWLIQDEWLTPAGFAGSAAMLAGCVLASLPAPRPVPPPADGFSVAEKTTGGPLSGQGGEPHDS